MDNRVGEAVARLRAGLDRRADPDDPFRPRGVDLLPPGVRPDGDLSGIPEPYAEFLRVADGATCGHVGEIHLWPAARVLDFQFTEFFLDVVAGDGYGRTLAPIAEEMRSWQDLLDSLRTG